MFGLKSLSLSFVSDQEAYAQIAFDRPLKLRIGLNGKYVFNKSGREDLPAAVKGKWVGTDIFLLEINEISDINDIMIRVSFGSRLPVFLLSERTLTRGMSIKLPLAERNSESPESAANSHRTP